VAQLDDLVALVGKGAARVDVVLAHLGDAVVHLAAGNQLVVRMREGAEHGVEVLPGLVGEVVEHEALAAGLEFGAWGVVFAHRVCSM